MKTNIIQIDYYGNLDSNGKWWKWTEVCDECGKQYRNWDIMTMNKPNTEEKDYCIDCLRKKCDNQGV
jgi:hypothetical protein